MSNFWGTCQIEFFKATCFLGIGSGSIYFLDFPTRQVGDNITEGEKKVFSFLEKLNQNDFVYFHCSDCHMDHRGVNRIVSNVLDLISKKVRPTAFQFFIWSKALAQGRSDVDTGFIPEIPKESLHISLTDNQAFAKKCALFEMKSQIDVWPYREWRPQAKPILDANFIEYFLSNEELFLAV